MALDSSFVPLGGTLKEGPVKQINEQLFGPFYGGIPAASVKEVLTPEPEKPVLNLDKVPSQVSFKNHTYPEDLMDSSQYGGNFVVFYIKILEDATLDAPGKPKTIPGIGRTDRDKSRYDGIQLTEKGVETAKDIFGGLVGAVALGTVSDFATKGIKSGINLVQPGATVSPKFQLALDAVKGLVSVTGAIVGAKYSDEIAAFYGELKQQYKITDTAIALYVPNELSVKYGASWRSTNMSLADAALRTLGAATDGDNANLNARLDSAGSVLSPALGYGASKILSTAVAGAALSKLSKTAGNPKKEQLFETIDFRTFQFNYRFYPRSEDEALAVQNIIKAFKYHMHPEFRKGTEQFLFAYPSEFDIVYYSNGIENKNLHKHTSCVLTDMTVNYTPDATFATHAGGMPNGINVSLIFRETAILTKEDIYEGF